MLDATEHGHTLSTGGLAQPRPPDRCAGISTFDVVSHTTHTAAMETLGVHGPAGVRLVGERSSIELTVFGGRYSMPASGRLHPTLDRPFVRRQAG